VFGFFLEVGFFHFGRALAAEACCELRR